MLTANSAARRLTEVVTMLPLTLDLLDRYERRAARLDWVVLAVEVIRRYGGSEDARALLDAFLVDPADRYPLLSVVDRHGDLSTAERLVEACCDADRLRPGMPERVLHTVGLLGYEPAERLLWNHVERVDPADPMYGVPEACLGLLHLSCAGIRGEIDDALARHYGASLFPEMLPVLATKTGDPSWLDRLIAWGEGAASSDCNGGLILGIALHGEAARDEFLRMLWTPWWEAYGGGTGANLWAYAGARVLGLDMAVLYDELKAAVRSDADQDDKRHCVRTFVALLELWLRRPWLGVRAAPDPTETYAELRDLLFAWSSPHRDNWLLEFAREVLHPDDSVIRDLQELVSLADLRAEHELELQAIAARATLSGTAG